MQKGKINVTSENIFPIIKKFLYSDHEIFLRELVSNATDATQKLKTLAAKGEVKGDLGDLTIKVSVDKDARTITFSDTGIGMTAQEIEKYINQIAFSGAEDFLDKYKDDANAIIGHFGLGFYSSFMVAEKVEIRTKSYTDAPAVRWECDGSPEFTLEEIEKENRGTDIILHVDKDADEFLEEARIGALLKKYCKFLPIEIAFGKETEYKDGKTVDTGKAKIINNTKPTWTKAPADLKDTDYNSFYSELYENSFDQPLFHIHLNVDYPFNLTGILYFPKITNNIEVQKNKIQLYSNQVFVTDSVEDIVPDFLTLLHGVIDSPDIPLNVSRSYLQSDLNVKKISGHITKKVADKLKDIFKNDRPAFEEKWEGLKLFIEYGILTNEKFFEKAKDFALVKNTDGKYFTFEEYEALVKENQTDKDSTLIYLYTDNKEKQYSFVSAAKDKGYDVLEIDGQFAAHYINHLESKFPGKRFVRVDSDVTEKLIQKEDGFESKLSSDDEANLTPVFQSQLPTDPIFMVNFEPMAETANPVMVTQNEFMRRMKDMSTLGGGAMGGYYGQMPDSYNLVVNSNHPLVQKISKDAAEKTADKVAGINSSLETAKADKKALDALTKDKKDEEISQEEKDKAQDLSKNIDKLEKEKKEIFSAYGKDNKLVKQMIDLGLLANNMLTGKALNKFVKRSVELIEA